MNNGKEDLRIRLLIVDDDPQPRAAVEGELRKRYGGDYEIICAGSADDPLRLLARLRQARFRLPIRPSLITQGAIFSPTVVSR